jgi:hypothetical protein
MDGERFDALAKDLFRGATRRRTMGSLLGGALLAIGLADPEAAYTAKSPKCPRKCGPCKKCDQGKCHKNKSGKRRCSPGKCQPHHGKVGKTCTDDGITGTCQSDGRCCRALNVNCADVCAISVNVSCTACCSEVCNGGLCT